MRPPVHNAQLSNEQHLAQVAGRTNAMIDAVEPLGVHIEAAFCVKREAKQRQP